MRRNPDRDRRLRPARRRVAAMAAAALVACSLWIDTGSAEVARGDVITRENVELAREFLHPGLEWCIDHGLAMEIVEYRKATYPAAYVMANRALPSTGRDVGRRTVAQELHCRSTVPLA